MDFSTGQIAEQQTHEANGAFQAGLGHLPVPDLSPKVKPLTHKIGEDQGYLTEFFSVTRFMKASSSHRHQADVQRAREVNARVQEALLRDLQAQVWADAGLGVHEAYLNWEAQFTAGYAEGYWYDVEILALINRAVQARKTWLDLGLGDEADQAFVDYVRIKDQIPQLVDEMVQNQTEWLRDQEWARHGP